MSECIVFCLLNLVTVLARVPHEELARCDDGVVVALDKGALLELLATGASVDVLYFDRPAYEEAVEGLSPEDIEEVVQCRRKLFSPDPIADAIDHLFRQERRSLTMTVTARSAAGGAAAQTLDRHVESKLRLMTDLTTEGRYDELQFTEMLIALLEAEAMVLAELEQTAEGRGPAADDEVDRRRRFAAPIARALQERGHEAYAKALPFADPTRAVFVSPRDEQLVGGLEATREPYVLWRDGLVTVWRVRELGRLEAEERHVTRLYAGSGVFIEEALTLTQAQLEREFAQRAGADDRLRALDLVEHLGSLRLELALLRRAVQERAKKEAPRIAETLATQMEEEAALLVDVLRRDRPWLGDAPPDTEWLDALVDSESRIVADAEFFAKAAPMLGQPALAERLAAVAREDLAPIEPLGSGG